MWPVSYNSTSSSDSATTRPGSSRCAATHSVVTSMCGWAYSANFTSGSNGSATACLTSTLRASTACSGIPGHHSPCAEDRPDRRPGDVHRRPGWPARAHPGARSARDEAANTLPPGVFAASPVRAPVLVRPEGGAEFVDLVGVAEEEVQEVLRPGAEVKAPVGGPDRPPGVQQDRSPPGKRDVPLARDGLGRRTEVAGDAQGVGDVGRLRVGAVAPVTGLLFCASLQNSWMTRWVRLPSES